MLARGQRQSAPASAPAELGREAPAGGAQKLDQRIGSERLMGIDREPECRPSGLNIAAESPKRDGVKVKSPRVSFRSLKTFEATSHPLLGRSALSRLPLSSRL